MTTTVPAASQRNRSSEFKKDIVKSHLGLVRYVAAKFGFIHSSSQHVLEEDDLVQIGLVGLLDAADKFDSRKGVRFETYAVTRIRGAILDEIRRLDWLPRSVRRRSRTARKVEDEIQDSQYNTLSADEIATKLSLTMEEFRQLMREAKTANMEYRMSYDDDVEIVEQTVADLATDPFELVSAEEVRSRLIEAVESLPQRDRLIITLYYYEGLTFREIGAVLRISESRVFQIHSTIMKSLQTQLKDLV